HLVFLSVTERLFPPLSGGGLQDILLDLLQRGLAADLSNRTQVDVPRSSPATVVSACLSVCAAGRFQTVLIAGCCRMHARHVSALLAYLRDIPFHCRPA